MNIEMRIIKFRGKAKENNIWLYGNIQIPSKENVGLITVHLKSKKN